MKFTSKQIILAVSAVMIAALLSGGFYYFGYKTGVQQSKTIIIEEARNIETPEKIGVDFSVFWQAWEKLKEEHVRGAEAKNQDLVYGAISGMVDSLKDPNTNFFPPEDSKKFEEDVNGSFGGIGAEIGIRDDQLVIVAPLKGSPAERAGLKSGDKILKVDDKVTAGMKVNDAVKIIRGEIGAKVVLMISRKDWENPKDISIVRETIIIPTVDWEMKEGNLAHIKLYNFSENAPLAFYKAGLEALLNGAQGVILDLRNDPGGFLEVAVHLAGWFLEKGSTVVAEEFRSGNNRTFAAQGNEALKDLPVVVIINQGSASASEILAGALRDNRGVKLIGEKSFGKGTVQELFRLKDDSSIKITVARWLLPNGQVIDENGLQPDYEVKLTEEDAKAGKDPQLEKAIEVLKAELSK
ncbi:MAG: hypothetical protein A2745_03500 [Candidatus Harrisonbacteria bacterium RIFCSPHIGHO2_01_FULL_44_13]|uniref:PDZ domain-containing protein n=1 Tax=Candidatus Harrisonbacteria bacterium RIFCSPLOWO2_01_FULL_44_18 TaxID=1798407 RepID=A0A1G1ZN72_9BACT|nr:MAG: hypothetical protein A2745_03500 [Candidatus Harrisonbacteria bacterium RIFCSPHIGHO2_01_FULL_44_13]OGY65985.1 MAG: hypothetical protein A3A16_01190 [Candidatus Harrisonbacteria bacterium RIFCSPLOWO2_01_FULL_44_18]